MNTIIPNLISCIMPTYGRPDFVSESVTMFLNQDDPEKELIVFNDCVEQTYSCEHPEVRVFNFDTRFATLGEKRNAAIEVSRGGFLAVWDDDDAYLPWRLSYCREKIREFTTEFYRPADFLAYWGDGPLHNNHSIPGWIGHPLTMFTRDLWESVGGYPAKDLAEDEVFFQKVHQKLCHEFVKYPIAPQDRFMIMRGKSHYKHMSIKGGENPLDTKRGHYEIRRQEIADESLLEKFRERIDLHNQGKV
ncbi:glycosyltransferase family A protein [Verrucomicrobiales bacterium BCK34]|nr:glycosyltransferase family A protein [Verrucomicrobiales bacterium BCK34]